MKKITLFFLLIAKITIVNSQWITIPDTYFAGYLQQQYPSCVFFGQMDTTCNAIINETILDLSGKNITNLYGIQFFDNLENLYCYSNQLTSLSDLPPKLKYLDCSGNSISSITYFPDSLKTIHCDYNQLSSLPSLPFGLLVLWSHNNQLTSLPSLPDSITYLSVSNNLLNTLPSLPASITMLSCNSNLLSSLPALPTNLVNLGCNNNQLNSLPTLPNNLKYLYCKNNQITILPALPNLLNTIDCSFNQIASFPPLPNSLKYIEANNNQLTSLPELPDSLNELWLQNNYFLTCLPQMKYINYLNFTNTTVQCIPNYGNVSGSVPPLSLLPFCNYFNPAGCQVLGNISGKIYGDLNLDCLNAPNEPGFKNLKLQLFKNGNLLQQAYSNYSGHYTFVISDTGTFTYTVDTTNLPVMILCPSTGAHNSLFTPIDTFDYNMDFAMQCKQSFDVGVNSIVRITGQFFPGITAIMKIGAGDLTDFYGLTCATGVSGNVFVDFTGPVTFISEAPGALVPVVNGNNLTYTIADFGLVNFNSDFRIIVQTDTTAQAGDQVCFTVNVTPTTGDNDVSNNSLQHCFTVVNSFDPNAKEVYPEGGLTPNQEWMTYTIHFQNTGNAPAQNIYILDTLDQNLIPSSFTLLSYSHEPLTQLFGNVIKFNFPYINLPDSTNDEPNSHGFVQYKVRIVQGLPVGTVISNTAYNYFDFNPPVATNTVSNVVGITSVANTTERIDLSVFPNPATNEINISFNLKSASEIEIKLYNSLGQDVKTISKTKYDAGKNLINFSVTELPFGVYYLKFCVDENVVVNKIIKY